MTYFVSVELFARRVQQQTSSLNTTSGVEVEGAPEGAIFASREAAREAFEKWCARAQLNRVRVANVVSAHDLTEDDADVGAVHEELQRALLEVAAPLPVAAVYADWLIARGDRRGDIASRFLQAGEELGTQLVRSNLRSLFGRFEFDVRSLLPELVWREGFLREAPIGWSHEHLSPEETTTRFLSLPVASTVTGIRIEQGGSEESLVGAVKQTPIAPQITTLVMNASARAIDAVTELPGLKHLTLVVGEIHGRAGLRRLLEHAALGRLNVLEVTPRGLISAAAIEVLNRELIKHADRLRHLKVRPRFAASDELRSALGTALQLEAD